MATSPHANPSRDPANDGTLIGMARQVLDKFLQGVDDMLPARVVSFNGDRNNPRVMVQPMVRVLTTDGRQVDRAQIASLPVMQFGGGGVVLSFNISPGDLGWIKANDRDVSLILQSYNDSAPNTLRKHSFQDAVFIPDVMRGVSVAAEDEGNAVLQSLDGSVKVAIWPDRVKLAAGGVSLTIGPASCDFVGHVNMPDGATINGIPFDTHGHTNVTNGPDTSGGPV